MMTKLSARDVWERKGVRGACLWFLLLPLSFFYAIIVQLRNALFTLGWISSVKLAKPVISVGNLTVGGTGKTPTCLWLAEALKSRGLRVGILSRGYHRHETAPVIVSPPLGDGVALVKEEDLARAGDEPLMMAELYGQTVAVGKKRAETAAELLRRHDVDVFLLDDGFQHRRIKRDVDLLLLGRDSSGWVLPAGPFREPTRNHRRADYLLVTGANGEWQSMMTHDRDSNLFFGSLRPISLLSLGSQQRKEFPLTLLYRSKILTVTGVADPSGFYRLIHEWEGEIVETLEFPDHHSYTARDWQQINRVGRLVDLIITTEKDILKLVRFPFAKDKLLALRVAMTVENGAALVDAIMEKINLNRSVHP
jgi:tetraacyldisaccharide 4'-kinase